MTADYRNTVGRPVDAERAAASEKRSIPGRDCLSVELATMTHRLRDAHVQTRVDTASPFPLHELRLLASSITF